MNFYLFWTSEPSIIKRCPYYSSVGKERFVSWEILSKEMFSRVSKYLHLYDLDNRFGFHEFQICTTVNKGYI